MLLRGRERRQALGVGAVGAGTLGVELGSPGPLGLGTEREPAVGVGAVGTLGAFGAVHALGALDTFGAVEPVDPFDAFGAVGAFGALDSLHAFDALEPVDSIRSFGAGSPEALAGSPGDAGAGGLERTRGAPGHVLAPGTAQGPLLLPNARGSLGRRRNVPDLRRDHGGQVDGSSGAAVNRGFRSQPERGPSSDGKPPFSPGQQTFYWYAVRLSVAAFRARLPKIVFA